MIRFVFSIILVFLQSVTPIDVNVQLGQNLVPNHSFEEFLHCPNGHSISTKDFAALHWKSGSQGTPDLFNKCSRNLSGVPYNWAGVSEAYDGNGYAGIYMWMDGQNSYREYILCELSEPLSKDSTYHIEFHYRLSSYSRYSIDRIGILLTAQLKKISDDQPIIEENVIENIIQSPLSPLTGSWEVMELTYTAKGGEKFLYIGNFSDNAKTRAHNLKFSNSDEEMLAASAYYYIDMVSVAAMYRLGESTSVSARQLKFDGKEIKTKESYPLNHVFFEYDRYELNKSSFGQLNEIYDLLSENISIQITISGFTDDRGDDSYNDLLSLNRATSVSSYLISLGISPDRITVIGYGKRRPLSIGVGDESRRLNRRVEVVFSEDH